MLSSPPLSHRGIPRTRLCRPTEVRDFLQGGGGLKLNKVTCTPCKEAAQDAPSDSCADYEQQSDCVAQSFEKWYRSVMTDQDPDIEETAEQPGLDAQRVLEQNTPETPEDDQKFIDVFIEVLFEMNKGHLYSDEDSVKKMVQLITKQPDALKRMLKKTSSTSKRWKRNEVESYFEEYPYHEFTIKYGDIQTTFPGDSLEPHMIQSFRQSLIDKMIEDLPSSPS